MQIPVTLTAQLLSIPNDLLTLRIQHITNETAENSAQQSLVTSQSSLIQAQTNLINAQQSELAAERAAVVTGGGQSNNIPH